MTDLEPRRLLLDAVAVTAVTVRIVGRFAAGPARRVTAPVGELVSRLGSVGPMRIRAGGRDVPVDRSRLAAAYPDATPSVVVLLHGLGESEQWWDDVEPRLGRRGWTPVRLRYDAGPAIDENGRRLADLLVRLCAVWPAGIERLALVGHGSGGLVARSALGYEAGPVRRVACLGSPAGSGSLEAWVLRDLTGSRTATSVRTGYLDEREWSPADPSDVLAEALTGLAVPVDVPVDVPGSRSRPGRWVGDLLVLPRGAAGAPPRHRFGPLRATRAYRRLRRWLG
jgi:pimeloyl-ACP methyl ester carboxylesterase